MNLIENFTQDLFKHLTKGQDHFKGCIIKTHSENLDSHGEFSLPIDIKPWIYYIKTIQCDSECNYKTILDYAYSNKPNISEEDICKTLVEDSKLWTLKIKKCHVADKRLYLFLDRAYAIKQYLNKQINLDEMVILNENKQNIMITQDKYSEEDLSACRLNNFIQVSKNLLEVAGYNVIFNDNSSVNNSCKLHFTMKSANKKSKDCLNVFSAPVLNDKTRCKESDLSSSQYFSKRVLDMQLIAQHKYGLRIKSEERWKIFLEQIGNAAVIFDLLQNKPSHPVSISSVDSASGCSKGVSFVLYNCARLSTILKKYHENVEAGLYPKLSPVEDIDAEHINDLDEWILMFNFMMGYSNLLKKCVNLTSKDCPILPHQLCTFLSALAGRFSIYYRRIRILLEPRKHLLPLVESRIHFLIALQKIFHHGLKILNIVPVTQM